MLAKAVEYTWLLLMPKFLLLKLRNVQYREVIAIKRCVSTGMLLQHIIKKAQLTDDIGIYHLKQKKLYAYATKSVYFI